MEEEEGIESVLATLQPLRDLAKNWDIDIATCLEEYLHDLVGHIPGAEDQLTIDGPSLNFAQAALVLQNSSNIYSRKVEYLYALVYKSLEENFQVQNGKVVRPRHADPDIDDFLAFDPYQEFLLLDDVLPTDDSPDNRKIDLVEEKAEESTPGRSMTRLSLTENKSVTAINDVAYKTLLDPHGSTLRLLKAPVAEDGWLRLPGTNSGKIQSSSTPLSPLPQSLQEPSGEESMEMERGFGEFNGGNDNDNDDDDGPGFFMNDDDEVELPVATQQLAFAKPARHVTFAESEPAPKQDPWALLDPHSVDSVTKAKPLKIGKSIRLPKGITEPPSACVTGARTRRIMRPNNPTSQANTATGKRRFDPTESFNSQFAFGKHSVNDDETVPFLPLQGLAFGDEFTYVYQATTKRLAAQRRELRQQEQSKAAQSNFDEEDDEDQYGDGFVFGYPQEGNTELMSLDEMYNRENDDAHTGATFEELCRAHLQAFAREAEKYASETKLTQRVDQWQQRLQPLLQEEEERPVFDIYEYGHQVIESLENEITKIPPDTNEKPSLIVDFSRVTRQKPNFEVCRLFLASLSLTNSGNVRFVETSADGNSLSIELLNREVELPTENYLAPSVRETSSMVM
ncbi:condensin-2 complex subunit H2 [Fistulifera solaris]|uniref:Condensin-2 complex subunit H2 n=1 Tax=Fistulifera solaris TaxID=1519565 RepID=A0A1Z5KRA5_FISSO|nr:condensin-2 complex subunit H2 [Fistulifera solaris]|eukprot:GAX28521.1 condensin-2 complex subunit H2 [Fistulifera solaris]